MEKNDRENIALLTELNTLVRILAETNERQTKINEHQTITLVKINENLNNLNSRLDTLENKFEEAESKNMIDIRETTKMGISKYLVPISAFGALFTVVAEKVCDFIK